MEKNIFAIFNREMRYDKVVRDSVQFVGRKNKTLWETSFYEQHYSDVVGHFVREYRNHIMCKFCKKTGHFLKKLQKIRQAYKRHFKRDRKIIIKVATIYPNYAVKDSIPKTILKQSGKGIPCT